MSKLHFNTFTTLILNNTQHNVQDRPGEGKMALTCWSPATTNSNIALGNFILLLLAWAICRFNLQFTSSSYISMINHGVVLLLGNARHLSWVETSLFQFLDNIFHVCCPDLYYDSSLINAKLQTVIMLLSLSVCLFS